MTPRDRCFRFLLASVLIVLVAGVLACSSGGSPASPDTEAPELEPFRVMARAYAECPPSTSSLWLVDDLYVVWGVETSCPDIGSPLRMFDVNTQALLCREWVDVAGGGVECSSAAPADMFETIRMNRDLPDLGLGPAHVVEAIPF